MPLRLKANPATPVARGEFSLPPLPPAMESRALASLRSDLLRFVTFDIAGRSFLIAGHRGAGKTSLVHRAVHATTHAVLGRLMDAATQPGGTPLPGLQNRPLLVKVHGPSLVTPRGQDDDPEVNPVLVQLTIALYRALAAEVAGRFADHARSLAQQPGHAGLPELAAQLALDLDAAPEPALLRARWQRLGRLRHGVVWPRVVAERLEWPDQGLREIVAIATAAQAFMVCTGAVTYKADVKESGTRSSDAGASGKGDVAGAAARIAALAAGGLVGASAAGSAGAAGAAAAIATAFGGVLALDWSAKRGASSTRSVDHTFIRDTKVTTLDRDLPVVIERIRAAGLAPVFVVDELDKVEDPREAIRGIIGRLKHIVTDFGFFCFLTDRRYDDELRELLRAEPYATEHSLFSHRFLIRYGPSDFATFLGEVTEAVPETAADDHPREVAQLANLVLWRSRLNTIEAIRELAGQPDRNGVIRPLPASFGEQLAVAVQLAITTVMEEPDLARQLARDALLAQMATDALYMIPRAWSQGAESVTTDRVTIATELVTRRGGRAGPDPVAQVLATVDEGDLVLIERAVADLVGYLSAFASLRRRLAGQAVPAPPTALMVDRVAALLPGGALLAEEPAPPGGARRWRFACDIHGGREGDTVAGDPLPAPERPRLEEALRVVGALEQALRAWR